MCLSLPLSLSSPPPLAHRCESAFGRLKNVNETRFFFLYILNLFSFLIANGVFLGEKRNSIFFFCSLSLHSKSFSVFFFSHLFIY